MMTADRPQRQQRLVVHYTKLVKVIKYPDATASAWRLDPQTGAWIPMPEIDDDTLRRYCTESDIWTNFVSGASPYHFVQTVEQRRAKIALGDGPIKEIYDEVVRLRASIPRRPAGVRSEEWRSRVDPIREHIGQLHRRSFRMWEEQLIRHGNPVADPDLADYEEELPYTKHTWTPLPWRPRLSPPPAPRQGPSPTGAEETLARLRVISVTFEGVLTQDKLDEVMYPLSLTQTAMLADKQADTIATRKLPVEDCYGHLAIKRGPRPDHWIAELHADRLRPGGKPPLAEDATVRGNMLELMRAVVLVMRHYDLHPVDMAVRPDVAIADSSTEKQPRTWTARFRLAMTGQTLQLLRNSLWMHPQGRLGDEQDMVLGDGYIYVGEDEASIRLLRADSAEEWQVQLRVHTAVEPERLADDVAPFLERIDAAITAIGSTVTSIETSI